MGNFIKKIPTKFSPLRPHNWTPKNWKQQAQDGSGGHDQCEDSRPKPGWKWFCPWRWEILQDLLLLTVEGLNKKPFDLRITTQIWGSPQAHRQDTRQGPNCSGQGEDPRLCSWSCSEPLDVDKSSGHYKGLEGKGSPRLKSRLLTQPPKQPEIGFSESSPSHLCVTKCRKKE